jgi:hypothetical protein
MDDYYVPGVDDVHAQVVANAAAAADIKIYPIATGYGVSIPEVATIHNIYASTTGGVVNNSGTGIVAAIISDTILNVPCPPVALDCTFSSDTFTINEGQSVNLTWSIAGNPDTVTLMPDNIVVPATGSMLVSPTVNTTYSLISVRGDVSNICTVEIKVLKPAIIKCPCAYDDPKCFEPCNWTVSYDPKQKLWISFHDWHPSLLMPSHEHFYTIKGKGIWKHNSRWDSFANYYGIDYPWEIEYPVTTPNNITTLRSIEYTLDVYKFFNDGKDFNHILDENFDRAIIHNSEQMSGLLRLKLKGKNNPLDLVNYPQSTANGIDILYSKEENRFRFNQFWDVTKDRGEFTGNDDPMWITKCSGYQRSINPDYVNYFKTPTEHKKFRHYGNKVILRKNVSGDKKMILKLTNSKHLNSPR